jgi:hypothetical protein
MGNLAKWFARSWGMILLGVWLLVYNLPPLLAKLEIPITLPGLLIALLGVVAGVCVLMGR